MLKTSLLFLITFLYEWYYDFFFCPGNLKGKFSISVEIKPKCGFLPDSRFISKENAIKKRITRFKMHQSLKLHQREISNTSEYDPLDMLSGSKERVHKAITALFCTPQNNFRVFLNGSLIFGGLGGGADITSCMIGNAFEDVLKCVIQADDGLRTTNFLQLVTEAVSRSGLLDRLLEVQKLDIFDIEGAIHAYYDVVSQPCIACRDLGEDKLSGR
ncbi:inositol-pentakisphosphate 2-kinase-like [Camellia sinensis]|uniref:inositol-pentakisphosphate 2-kinase-like n=1 Tax=Camellia sinensis TaxID=4442 RepID=UPI001036796C|nr:inositol-pentakisphosphate 2-kinase-like [Camellia sinensis]